MQQPRKQLKLLKAAARQGDSEAARVLLAHSVALGHERLSVRRYFAAKALGASGIERFKPYCQAAARRLGSDALLSMARDAPCSKDALALALELLCSSTAPPGAADDSGAAIKGGQSRSSTRPGAR
jgi:hypothetical protein